VHYSIKAFITHCINDSSRLMMMSDIDYSMQG